MTEELFKERTEPLHSQMLVITGNQRLLLIKTYQGVLFLILHQPELRQLYTIGQLILVTEVLEAFRIIDFILTRLKLLLQEEL